jgi:BirA family transcriptional regulator, biotin operon repressor / biotin---[acetyl-CoA-carboxylase] ligase
MDVDGDWVWKHAEVTGSTNVDAEDLARENPGRVVVVRADRQEAGRGRAGRAWSSPLGGAWFSIGVPVGDGDLEKWMAAPLVVGLAACEGVNEAMREAGASEQEVKIKWPNDLVLGGKKAGGVLCELVRTEKAGRVLIAGIGINVNLRAGDLPAVLRFPGTTLREATGREFAIDAMIERVARKVVAFFAELERGGFKGRFQEAVEARMAWLGEEVGLDSGEAVAKGRIAGVDEYGRLKAMVGDVIKVFDSGEVRVLGDRR